MEGRFRDGQQVRKTDGTSRFPGEVRATFTTRSGAIRVVVEATHPDYAGLLHIYREDQLE